MDGAFSGRYQGRMIIVRPLAGAAREALSHTIFRADSADPGARRRHLCVAADAWIATPDGPVRAAELRAGAAVYALDPAAGLRLTRVATHGSAGVQQLLRIDTAGRSLRVTATQDIATVVAKGKRGGALRKRPAGELAKDDVIVCAEGYFSNEGAQSAELARLMGVFLGTGYIERGRVGATVGQWCDPHTERYAALFETLFSGAGWQHGAGISGGISSADPAAAAQLEQLGFVRAMDSRVVPRWAYALPREGKLALLAGFMDAAGRMSRDSKKALTGAGEIRAQFCPSLVREVRELAIGAALDVSAIHLERPKDPTLSSRSLAALSPASMAQLPCWDPNTHVASAVTLPRLGPEKLGGVSLPPGAFAQKIKAVEPEPAAEVFSLEVEDPSESFVVEGVVLHH